MWKHFGGIVLFAVLIAVIPFAALNIEEIVSPRIPAETARTSAEPRADTQENNELPAQEGGMASSGEAAGQPEPEPPAQVVETGGSFRILDTAAGKVVTVTEQEYVRGAVAAEMPPTFHPEALKAQAVAAHTYALCTQKMQREAPDPALKGADFSADPGDWKGYTTEALFRERYGDMADAYWNAVAGAADQVRDYIMLYDGDPIVAAYHSMNTGMTEDAANVWTGSVPYLTPVESRGDLLAPDYETKQRFPAGEVGDALRKAYDGIQLGEDPAAWFQLGERSESGYVLTVRAGDVTMPAKDLRTLLGLRSTAFTLDYAGDEFCFTVRGYGHGVGLSQYGADFYARQGMDFTEILEHYYPGAELGLARSMDGEEG